MDFFFPRRDIMYDNSWRYGDRQENQQQRRRYRQQQPMKNYDEDLMFGNSYFRRPSNSCNCINCNMEYSLSEDQRRNQIPSSKIKRELINKRKPKKVVLKNSQLYCSSSDEMSESDQEESFQNPLQNLEPQPEMTGKENLGGNQKDTNTTEGCNDCTTYDDDDDFDSTTTSNQKDSDESRREEISKKIDLINNIKNDLEKIRSKIEEIAENTTKGKDYLYCEEMLTKNLLRLDEILADGEETIRKARKQAVNEVTDAIQYLEGKISDGEQTS